MEDNDLVGLLGIYVMRDMFFAEDIKKNSHQKLNIPVTVLRE